SWVSRNVENTHLIGEGETDRPSRSNAAESSRVTRSGEILVRRRSGGDRVGRRHVPDQGHYPNPTPDGAGQARRWWASSRRAVEVGPRCALLARRLCAANPSVDGVAAVDLDREVPEPWASRAACGGEEAGEGPRAAVAGVDGGEGDERGDRGLAPRVSRA